MKKAQKGTFLRGPNFKLLRLSFAHQNALKLPSPHVRAAASNA